MKVLRHRAAFSSHPPPVWFQRLLKLTNTRKTKHQKVQMRDSTRSLQCSTPLPSLPLYSTPRVRREWKQKSFASIISSMNAPDPRSVWETTFWVRWGSPGTCATCLPWEQRRRRGYNHACSPVDLHQSVRAIHDKKRGARSLESCISLCSKRMIALLWTCQHLHKSKSFTSEARQRKITDRQIKCASFSRRSRSPAAVGKYFEQTFCHAAVFSPKRSSRCNQWTPWQSGAPDNECDKWQAERKKICSCATCWLTH